MRSNKKKLTPMLDLYIRWMNRACRMSDTGLCAARDISHNDTSRHEAASPYDTVYNFDEVMGPIPRDVVKLFKQGKHQIFWGSDDADALIYHFTKLRQTLLLFWAAYLGEL